MRAWGQGALPINKMASKWLSMLGLSGCTKICVAHGIVSWGSKDNDAAGELQLWDNKGANYHYLYASNTAGVDMLVCKVMLVSTYPAAGNCFQNTRYPAVTNFDQFSRNGSFNSSKNIRYLFRNVKRL